MDGWDLKKGMSKLIIKFDNYSSKWEKNYNIFSL